MFWDVPVGKANYLNTCDKQAFGLAAGKRDDL
jgi:hypothetical protein